MNVMSDIICGDCIEVMCDIDSDSVDCIVTDPPYGMSFMGKNWDKAVPSVKTWQECLRVLKPGAFAFVMCIPRQDCLAHMICNLSDAGFNTVFSSIYHTFANGFPKAQNLSKIEDKRAGVKREVVEIESTIPERPITKKWKAAYNIPKGKGPFTSKNGCLREITIPATLQAKALDGAYSGFQPKPAVEIIIVVMKPLSEKTYIDQALKNGHGCTWLNDCRIPYNTEADKDNSKGGFQKTNREKGLTSSSYGGSTDKRTNDYIPKDKGRFPANVLCEDNVLDDGIKRKSGANLTHHKRSGNSNLGKTFKIRDRTGEFADWKSNSGEYSRYFSLDAWFAERIKLLPKEAQKTFPWLIVPKASKSEKNRGCEALEGTVGFGSENKTGAMLPSKKIKSHEIKGNFHPTCKPLKLMSWLITLASREGDRVLDPFCGSGTTCIAAKMIGRHYIGIEKEAEYCEIARKRISAITEGLSRFM